MSWSLARSSGVDCDRSGMAAQLSPMPMFIQTPRSHNSPFEKPCSAWEVSSISDASHFRVTAGVPPT